MSSDEQMLRVNAITEKVIGAAFRVSNTLGVGFLEKVYENALFHELKKEKLEVQKQVPIKVWYEDIVVGDYTADLMVEGTVLVELKVAKSFDDIHLAQCLNYLKATKLSVCLLINFGLPKVEIKRIINKL